MAWCVAERTAATAQLTCPFRWLVGRAHSYEMMCADPAFADPDQSRIFVKILNSDRFLKFPPFFPNGARKFLLGLLEPKPYLRLGCASEAFFIGVDESRQILKLFHCLALKVIFDCT